MKFFQTFVLSLLLPLFCHAAKKSSKDVFAKYHQKASSSTPLKINDASFDEITAIPRNHSALIILTALAPEMRCGLCREVQPEFQLLAKSWMSGDKEGESKLLFGSLDFQSGRKTFESLMLQTAPILLLFPPTSGPHAVADPKPIQMDFAMGPQSAEQIHKWLSRHLPASTYAPPIRRPFNYIRFAVTSIVGLSTVMIVVLAWPYLGPIIQNRNVWAAGCILAILLFISGHMYNQIRGAPYVAMNDKRVSYFAGGFQNQYGIESQIVAVMYGILALSMIALTLRVPRMKNPGAQRVAVFAWGAIMLSVYSLLLSIFRLKNGGYPFWLPPF